MLKRWLSKSAMQGPAIPFYRVNAAWGRIAVT